MVDFKTLNFWRRSYNLSLEIYKITASFPQDEKIVYRVD